MIYFHEWKTVDAVRRYGKRWKRRPATIRHLHFKRYFIFTFKILFSNFFFPLRKYKRARLFIEFRFLFERVRRRNNHTFPFSRYFILMKRSQLLLYTTRINTMCTVYNGSNWSLYSCRRPTDDTLFQLNSLGECFIRFRQRRNNAMYTRNNNINTFRLKQKYTIRFRLSQYVRRDQFFFSFLYLHFQFDNNAVINNLFIIIFFQFFYAVIIIIIILIISRCSHAILSI